MGSLSLISKELDERLCRLTEERRRSVGVAACKRAMFRTKLSSAVSRSALDSIQAGVDLTSDTQLELSALMDRYDEEYVHLKDVDPKAKIAFALARTVAAILSLSKGDVSEAIYEASFACGDETRSAFLSFVSHEMVGGTNEAHS